MRFLDQVNISNTTVVVRANLDIKIINDTVVDKTHIEAIIPTIDRLIKNSNKVLLLSHLGPKTGEYSDEFSLMPIRFEIARSLGKTIKYVSLDNSKNSIKFMEFGDVLMFENLYFNHSEFSGSEEERIELLKPIIEVAEWYVDEAFGVDDSLTSMGMLKSKILNHCYGLHYRKELDFSKKVLSSSSPKVVILGGEFRDYKIDFMLNNFHAFDTWLIGGSLALDILSSIGVVLGSYQNKLTESQIEKLKAINSLVSEHTTKCILPVDHMCENEQGQMMHVSTQNIDEPLKPKDVGPNTLLLFRETIEAAETIFWNGPLGVFESENFNYGTESVGEYIALSAPRNALKVACGGDTLLALAQLKVKHKRFSHLSLSAESFMNCITSEYSSEKV